MIMQPVGLLVSQIGYDLEASMRALFRGPLPDGATFRLQDAVSREIVLGKPLVYWGNCWQSDWWIADF
jgi:hypothetical protein